VHGSHSYIRHLFTGYARDRGVIAHRGLGKITSGTIGSGIEYYSESMLTTKSSQAYLQPRLEIDTDKVIVAKHYARVIHVLPEQLFYLETRGIPYTIAYNMIVYGYLLRGIIDQEFVEKAKKLITNYLGEVFR
jgi:Fe-S cluster assembly scaffold protein SufB